MCNSEGLHKDGWIKTGISRSSYDDRFDLFIRRRKAGELIVQNEEKIKKSSERYFLKSPKNVGNSGVSVPLKMVSKKSMGGPKAHLTPISNVLVNRDNLPVLSDFGAYPSLVAARPDQDALVIAFDSEWYYEDHDESMPRIMLSWQFAVIRQDELWEFVFLRKADRNLWLELALGLILDVLGLASVDVRKVRRYKSLGEIAPETGVAVEGKFYNAKDAIDNSVYLYGDGKKCHTTLDWSEVNSIPVVLLCHAGKVDLSGLDQSGAYRTNILRYCSEVQGGLISLQPIRLTPDSAKKKSGHNQYKYPVSLQIADTMCHAPAGQKSLKALGHVVGYEKVELDDGEISRMDQLLENDPCKYFMYASNDSVVTLLYAAALYGYNKQLPVTVTSATAKVMKEVIEMYLGVDNAKDFDRKYRGLQTVGHGLVPREDRPGYIHSTSKEPISDKANTIQYYASQAYHGGYNSCSEIGYFPQMTWDYDLQNAYPTAMCLVPDIDWENPIKAEIINRELTLNDFRLPYNGEYDMLSPMLAYVRFEFPETVKYPCIPVNVDGIPIYPRTSEGLDGVYACAPELYLALRLGAKVFVERGFFLNCLYDEGSGETSYSLCAAVRQLVADRARAKAEHGKKSIEELILKTMVNSGYGKTAQNVVPKTTWTAYKNTMVDLGCSSITNPISACLTTSIVRAELLAAQNQCHALGYMSCSVTTDGFISDIPEDLLKSLDLYGIRRFMEKARLLLTGGESCELWEVKHWQDDLVNFTTRGNVSLLKNGVCAHNSTKSGYEPDSYEDRCWLMTQVLSRTGPVEYTAKEWTQFKQLVQGKDFAVKSVSRRVHMDFDMKRKPLKDSFTQKFVPLNGVEYEVANFTTMPYESVTEFKMYRELKKGMTCLRTMPDWDIFWSKAEVKGAGLKVRDMDWAILNTCIMGHRAGFWRIPKLTELSGQARSEWINSHNTSKKRWKDADWKNAGRNSRQANMLPRELIQDKLEELMGDKTA